VSAGRWGAFNYSPKKLNFVARKINPRIYFCFMENQIIYNRSYLKTNRKRLRNNSTLAEVVLWKYIKGKQILNTKFRRQHAIGNHIVDFYCTDLNLIIELDGNYHFTEDGILKDEKRDRKLENRYENILRFENKLVLERIETVLKVIEEKVRELKLSN
jgi:very-short-patch-repair endonuclease